MVGHAILGKVVRADFLGAVTGANLSAPLARARRLLLRHDAVEQARAQDLHRLDLVLQLGLLILALYLEPRGEVRDANGAVRCVDALAAGAARAKDVDAQILILDLDVDLFSFW